MKIEISLEMAVDILRLSDLFKCNFEIKKGDFCTEGIYAIKGNRLHEESRGYRICAEVWLEAAVVDLHHRHRDCFTDNNTRV